MKKIVLALGGSSGSIYAKLLLDKISGLRDQFSDLAIVMSENAKINWKLELGDLDIETFGFPVFGKNDFNAPFASGSSMFNIMIICPCSMGLLSRIAHGTSDNLTARAADVMLKERRRLILVPRETPYNLIHIENMRAITMAGGIICPASPSFYKKPVSIDDLCNTVVDRVLDLAGFDIQSYRWGS
jgi:4-hydroxy-3-polyprenylbenzoate decarboxylase